MRLQLLGALIATSLALSATLTAAYNVLPVSPGLLGLSLVYSLSIVNNLNGLVGSLTETEQEMISVERVHEYSDLPNEHKLNGGNGSDGSGAGGEPDKKDDGVDASWPVDGRLEFRGVSMRYAASLPLALRNIDLVLTHQSTARLS